MHNEAPAAEHLDAPTTKHQVAPAQEGHGTSWVMKFLFHEICKWFQKTEIPKDFPSGWCNNKKSLRKWTMILLIWSMIQTGSPKHETNIDPACKHMRFEYLKTMAILSPLTAGMIVKSDILIIWKIQFHFGFNDIIEFISFFWWSFESVKKSWIVLLAILLHSGVWSYKKFQKYAEYLSQVKIGTLFYFRILFHYQSAEFLEQYWL